MDPDPSPQLAAGREYQRRLLDAAAAAGPDPAESQSRTPAILREMLAGESLDRRKAPGEWTVRQILGHIIQAEIVWSTRYRWAIAEVEPPVQGYEQDLWVDNLLDTDGGPEGLIDVFTALREANIRLWRATTPEQRARTVLQSERGLESLDLMFRMITGHDQVHLGQAKEALGG